MVTIERVNKTQLRILEARVQEGAKILRQADQLKIDHMKNWVNKTLDQLTWKWLKPLVKWASRRGKKNITDFCLRIQGLAGLPITEGRMCIDFHILRDGKVIREYRKENMLTPQKTSPENEARMPSDKSE